jgi:acyl carrier protein
VKQHRTRDAASVDLIKSWLFDWLAQELRIDRETIDSRQSFLSYGMDSVQAMTMVGDLEANLEVRLPPTLAWDYPDIQTLSAHLADCLAPSSAPPPPPQSALAASQAKIESVLAELDDPDVDGLLNQYANRPQL